MKMTDIELGLMNRRISLAMSAQKNVNNKWGKQYWGNVLAHLLREARRLN